MAYGYIFSIEVEFISIIFTVIFIVIFTIIFTVIFTVIFDGEFYDRLGGILVVIFSVRY